MVRRCQITLTKDSTGLPGRSGGPFLYLVINQRQQVVPRDLRALRGGTAGGEVPYGPATAGTFPGGSYDTESIPEFLTSPPPIALPVRQPRLDPATYTQCVAGTHSASDHLFGVEKRIMATSVCTYPLARQLSVHARRVSSMPHPL